MTRMNTLLTGVWVLQIVIIIVSDIPYYSPYSDELID